MEIIENFKKGIGKASFMIGQRLDDNQIEKMAELSYYKIVEKQIFHTAELTAHRIETVFDLAVNDVYGECKKLYPKIIIEWFKQQKNYEKRTSEEQQLQTKEMTDEEAIANSAKWYPYISWRMAKNIHPDDVTIEMYWDAFKNKKIKDLEIMFGKQKKNNLRF